MRTSHKTSQCQLHLSGDIVLDSTVLPPRRVRVCVYVRVHACACVSVCVRVSVCVSVVYLETPCSVSFTFCWRTTDHERWSHTETLKPATYIQQSLKCARHSRSIHMGVLIRGLCVTLDWRQPPVVSRGHPSCWPLSPCLSEAHSSGGREHACEGGQVQDPRQRPGTLGGCLELGAMRRTTLRLALWLPSAAARPPVMTRSPRLQCTFSPPALPAQTNSAALLGKAV